MDTGELIQKYIALRDHVEAQTRVFEESLKPYKDGMKTIEDRVTADILACGGESIKTKHGTAYRTQVMAVKMADREAFMDFVQEDWVNRNGFLTSAVTKEMVKEYLEEHNAKPPGLDIAFVNKTNFRRS